MMFFLFVIAEEGSKRSKCWRPVHAGDMGLVHKPALKNYWSADPVTQMPFFGEYMSLNSFELISQKLHFDNDSQISSLGSLATTHLPRSGT